MKTLVGLAIVGMCMFSSICYAEDIDADDYIKVTTLSGKTYSCNQNAISSGCKIIINGNFCTLLNVPEHNSTSAFLFISLKNYKLPINRIKEIEYK